MADAARAKTFGTFFGKHKKAAPAGSAAKGEAGVVDASVPASSTSGPAPSSDPAASTSGWVDEDLAGDGGAAGVPIAVGKVVVMGVSDTEFAATLGGETSTGVDVEAEEARRALHETLRKASAKKPATGTPGAGAAPGITTSASSAPAAAAATPTFWAARSARTGIGAAAKGGKVDVNNTVQFPTLSTAVSGLPPAAKLESELRPVASLASRNKWADLAAAGGEDEEGEEDADGPGASVVPLTAWQRVTEADVVMKGSTPIRNTDVAVTSEAASIARELETSSDVKEAVERLLELRTDVPGRRGRAIEYLIQHGLDAESGMMRSTLNRVFVQLVHPARFVTLAVFQSAVETVMKQVDDLKVDYPIVDRLLADLLAGLVPDMLSAHAIHPLVAARMGLSGAGGAAGGGAGADGKPGGGGGGFVDAHAMFSGKGGRKGKLGGVDL